MKKYAIIKNGKVVNVAIWDGERMWSHGRDEVVELQAGQVISAGWDYVDNEFIVPIEPEEEE